MYNWDFSDITIIWMWVLKALLILLMSWVIFFLSIFGGKLLRTDENIWKNIYKPRYLGNLRVLSDKRSKNK